MQKGQRILLELGHVIFSSVEFAHLLIRMQVRAETVVVDGDPKEMICHFAEQMQADLLVVGSRGLSKIRRYAKSNTCMRRKLILTRSLIKILICSRQSNLG